MRKTENSKLTRCEYTPSFANWGRLLVVTDSRGCGLCAGFCVWCQRRFRPECRVHIKVKGNSTVREAALPEANWMRGLAVEILLKTILFSPRPSPLHAQRRQRHPRLPAGVGPDFIDSATPPAQSRFITHPR